MHTELQNLGSVVALLEGNFEKNITLRPFLRQTAKFVKNLKCLFGLWPFNSINQHMAKNNKICLALKLSLKTFLLVSKNIALQTALNEYSLPKLPY